MGNTTPGPITRIGLARSTIWARPYNARSTNLRPFEARGGKLIVWHGLVDESTPAASTIAFHQEVQKQLGDKLTDSFMRLFLLPSVGHWAARALRSSISLAR
jgi:hypothetical protein